MTSSQEIRPDGWQADYGKLTRTVSVLAATIREMKARQDTLRDLARAWRYEADGCISVAMATALRGCADQVEAAIGPAGCPEGACDPEPAPKEG